MPTLETRNPLNRPQRDPTINAAAIVCYTTSGSTALRAARERPDVPILVLTSKIETARRLSVTWGAHCVETADVTSFQEIGRLGNANLATVAPGIGGALVAMAFGLFAAIPAVIAYNYFVNRIRVL